MPNEESARPRRGIGAVPAPGLVLGGIVSTQLGASLAKHLFTELPPSAVVTVRLITAAGILAIFAWPKRRKYTRADIVVVALFGLSLALMNFSFYQAIARIPLGVAVTIEFLGPLAVAVVGSRRLLDVVWVVLAGGGVALLASGDAEIDLVGVLWALLAAACWASYIGFSAATGRRIAGTSGLTLAMCLGAVLVAPVGIVEGGADLLRVDILLFGAGAGLLSSAVPYALELEALRRMPARVFGILLSLEPAVAALVGLIVLREVLSGVQWLAIACVVIASVGASRSRQDGLKVPEA